MSHNVVVETSLSINGHKYENIILPSKQAPRIKFPDSRLPFIVVVVPTKEEMRAMNNSRDSAPELLPSLKTLHLIDSRL